MAECTKKDITKSFNDLGLCITIQSNLKTFNFLDITLNLCNGKYYPYRKPNDRLLYINRLSNYLPSILKPLPAAISRHLTDMSHDAEVFKKASPLYNNALRNSKFMNNVEYVEGRKVEEPGQKRSRMRRITLFNPPYSKNVVTRIGQKFIRLIDRHFFVGPELHKIFNRSKVKVSYSCMPNMGTIIKRHNAGVCGAGSESNDQHRRSNSRETGRCPSMGSA